MNKNHTKIIYSIFLLLIFIAAFTGCASTDPSKFQKKIEQMPDTDLVNYYHGINDRIKDIDNKVRDEQVLEKNLNKDNSFVQSPFYIGGHGHELVRERELIKKELNKRNIAY
ncbi:Uncharacterized protein dnl_52620 [Desulfonema limicola]|uniref:Lipoprotein n=1 Tax=Desulfonema limicola TaxID=45656 RepID=A0A975BCJ5_9BACT|nr:hypothetical protein [Desulfonema limicola]QTA82876.1 Uncharacterized protein dnl_52620 [Desulfonema limicola]